MDPVNVTKFVDGTLTYLLTDQSIDWRNYGHKKTDAFEGVTSVMEYMRRATDILMQRIPASLLEEYHSDPENEENEHEIISALYEAIPILQTIHADSADTVTEKFWELVEMK